MFHVYKFFILVLGPINSTAQLILNSKPEVEGFKRPKVWLNVVMEEIVVGLSRLQVSINFCTYNC